MNGEYPSIVPELSLYRVEAELAATQAELAGADKVISNLKVLCQRAADALEEAEPMVREPVPDTEMHSDWIKLIDELRKAAG